jgi:S-methylmethionine-dependent homocysteine/selenocysteine methylase
MISFCCAEAEAGRPGVLLSGEPLVDLLPELTGAAAIGVNCVWPDAAVSHASLLRRLIPAGAAVRLMAYANIGRADPRGHWVCTDAVDPERYAAHAARWLEAGASIVGGCCGTTPRHIGAIRRMLSSRGGGFSPAEET